MCDACEKIVTKDELIMEGIAVTPMQAPVQFHVECFYLWDQERRAIPKEGAVSCARPWPCPEDEKP
jgi:hypothetical protein